MKTKDLVLLSVLVGVGAVLHIVIPPIFLGIKPDMLLTMMFLGIVFFPRTQYVFILSMATGVISGLTTSMPGGQIANMIEKPITAFLFFGLFLIVKKFSDKTIVVAILGAIGTIISGSIFLTIAITLASLPSFIQPFLAVVLPATALNTIFLIIVYPIVQSIFQRLNIVKKELA